MNQTFISTPYHTIPKDKILSISVGTDDKNPDLCALMAHMINGQSIMFLAASHISIVHDLKRIIEEHWEQHIFVDQFLPTIVNNVKEKNQNRPIVYSYISEDHLVHLYEKEKKRIEEESKK